MEAQTKPLEGKTALVTGSTSGIGKAIAKKLVELGADVIVHGKTPTRTKNAQIDVGGIEGLYCDLDIKEDVAKIGEILYIKKLDPTILVNCAAIAIDYPAENISLKQWDQIIQVNLTAAFQLSQAVFPFMKAAGWGRIVNISSIAGHSFSKWCGIHYSISKAGLVTMTKQLAWEWAKYGIAVNCVCPGQTDTKMLDPFRDSLDEIQEGIPDGLVATPEEVANAATWLCLPKTTHVNGAIINVSGGVQ